MASFPWPRIEYNRLRNSTKNPWSAITFPPFCLQWTMLNQTELAHSGLHHLRL